MTLSEKVKIFRDLYSPLRNGKVCKAIKELFVTYVKDNYPETEIVVGLESRGFLYSFLVACELGIGFVPIRKKNKLPGETFCVEYSLDYGKV
jgi:adenine phosphoribosyltransferase